VRPSRPTSNRTSRKPSKEPSPTHKRGRLTKRRWPFVPAFGRVGNLPSALRRRFPAPEARRKLARAVRPGTPAPTRSLRAPEVRHRLARPVRAGKNPTRSAAP
jgi:hypothetical protein